MQICKDPEVCQQITAEMDSVLGKGAKIQASDRYVENL